MEEHIDYNYKSSENLMLILAMIKDMKALLNDFHEYLNKNNEVTLKEIIEEYFYDLKYFKRVLKDDKKVADLYVSSLIKSVETLEEDKLKKNVEQLYEIFCLDVDLDEFYLDANLCYKDMNEIYKTYEKIV